MCGIVVSITTARSESALASYSQRLNALRTVNALRGPDVQTTVTRRIETVDNTIRSLSLTASVLHLRGDHVTSQPHTNQNGDVLCWNGEIFQGITVDNDENDGFKLFAALTVPSVHIPDVFAGVEGPYAFVFYRASDHSLFFGRDPLGRRSLLIRRVNELDSSWSIELASVSLGAPGETGSEPEFCELTPAAIFQFRLDQLTSALEPLQKLDAANYDALQVSPTINTLDVAKDGIIAHWRAAGDKFSAQHILNCELPDSSQSPLLDDQVENAADQIVHEFIKRLEESVAQRVLSIPSGETDGTSRLAVLFSGGIDCTVIAYMAHRFIPINEPIDLLNVAFENPRSLKAQRGRHNRHAPPSNDQDLRDLTHPTNTYDVPDRQTGLEELEELKALCPGRIWNFVKVDVTFEESTALRPMIEKLMFPSRTVMDMSLAMALYFATRGIGTLSTCSNASGPAVAAAVATEESKPYVSPARVLLSGLGSDELLGGYSRHRVSFANNGWEGLIDELQLDLNRLPSRNLGRDDRVISANAKETHYPFLNLSLVAYLAALPVYTKVDPRLGEGAGDKLVLRLAAKRLGLMKAANRRKRAMQFGSRSAKMTESANERKGTFLVS